MLLLLHGESRARRGDRRGCGDRGCSAVARDGNRSELRHRWQGGRALCKGAVQCLRPGVQLVATRSQSGAVCLRGRGAGCAEVHRLRRGYRTGDAGCAEDYGDNERVETVHDTPPAPWNELGSDTKAHAVTRGLSGMIRPFAVGNYLPCKSRPAGRTCVRGL